MRSKSDEERFIGMTLAKLSRKILSCLFYEVDKKKENVTFVISTDELSEVISEVSDSIMLGSTVQEKRAIVSEIAFKEILEKMKEVTEKAMIR